MSWTYLGDTTPKARKPHTCFLCERRIETGEIHVARRGVYDGAMGTFRMHSTCHEVTKEWGPNEWEYTDPDSFREYLATKEKTHEPNNS